jgi:hypothetical protein
MQSGIYCFNLIKFKHHFGEFFFFLRLWIECLYFQLIYVKLRGFSIKNKSLVIIDKTLWYLSSN